MTAVLVVAWFALPALLVPTIQRKLQAMMASQLQADVRLGSLRYAPPYGVRVRDVSVTAADPEHGKVEVLSVDLLDLKLAELPLGKGPLIIENVTIRRPKVHVVIAGGDLAGRKNIVRPLSPEKPEPAPSSGGDAKPMTAPAPASPSAQAAGSAAPSPSSPQAAPAESPTPPRMKLSEMFRLRHFGMYDGAIVIENRDRPGSAPMVWRALDVEMQTEPQSASAYGFRFGTDPQRAAQIAANGSFDLDDLWIQTDSFHLTLAADKDDSEERSALPAQIQAMLARYELKGRVTLDLTGRVPLRSPRQSNFSGSLELADGSGALPNKRARIDDLDFRLAFAKDAPPQPATAPADTRRPIRLEVQRLTFASGPARVKVLRGSAAVDDTNATWSLTDLTADIDFGANPDAPGFGSPLAFRFVGSTGRAAVRLSCGGKIGVTPGGGGIDVGGMTLDAQVVGLTAQPPTFQAPLTSLECTARKTPGTGVVLLTNGACAYAGDRIRLTRARFRLPADLLAMRDGFRLDEIEGTFEMRPPRPTPYPVGFGRTIEMLRPSGVFQIGGGSWFAFDRLANATPPAATAGAATTPTQSRRKIDYFFSVGADDARFDLLDGRLVLTGLRGDASFSPEAYRVDHVRADAYGGSVAGNFHITPGRPMTFDAEASLSGIQLKEIGEAFGLPPARREKLSGTGYLSAASVGVLPGSGDDEWPRKLRARGVFEIFGGHFWSLPVLADIAGLVGRSDRLTAGEAAGRFDVNRGGVDLTNAAVQSPALGIVGSGRIGFDKTLDLKVIAAPLGDWRERAKRGGIPLLSDAAGEVFGAMQKVLNKATSRLLYEFRVSGTLAQPEVDTVPVPALTEPAALLFGQMIGDSDDKGHGKWAETAKKE